MIMELEYNEDLDEYFIVVPESMLAKLEWEEGDMLEAMGVFKFDTTYSPMGFEEQMQIFNDNKSGKVGVGIFASLGSFLADNQDKDIILGHIDPKTLRPVRDPVRVLDENGKEIELYNLTKPGSIGDSKENTRTKGDNNSMVMTESVDNSKNKRERLAPVSLRQPPAFVVLETSAYLPRPVP
jgi:hypothetical protein